MFPNIPEDRTGASASVLRGYVRVLRAFIRERLAIEGDGAAEALGEAEQAHDLAEVIGGEIRRAELAEASDEADDPQDPEDDDDDDVDDEASDTGDDGDDDDDDDDDDDNEASNRRVPAVHTGTSSGAAPAPVTYENVRPDILLARDGVAGVKAGDPFEDWNQVADALLKRAGTISPSSTEKFEVAYIEANFPAERKLTGDAMTNMRLLSNLGFHPGLADPNDELTAALCAPLTPYYAMACENTLRRPVAGSLPGFEAPRGGVSIMPSPSLSDVSAGGIWTHDDDDADPFVPKDCDEIVCGTPEDFIMYAVWWCLTIKNWEALTFPELVAAFLNRGLARRARIAETQLLDAMGAGVAQLATTDLGYSASVRITTQILTYLSLLREQQRWEDQTVNGWAHRWLAAAMQVDLARRRRSDGAFVVPSLSTINGLFAEVGVNMTWTLDAASWMTPPGALADSINFSTTPVGTLNNFPTSAEILLAPPGKYAMIQRAQVAVGITGDSRYRDTSDLLANRFRFFVENYEGVVDTNSCPAHILTFDNLCYTGVQIDDVVIDCDGTLAA